MLPRIPRTQIFTALNDQVHVFIRSWSGPELVEPVSEEVIRYLSAADADLEVTTPFEFHDNLSDQANRTRIALRLANDLCFSRNKQLYSHGHEVAVFYKTSSELAYAVIGRFGIEAETDSKKIEILNLQSAMDAEVILPVDLIGLVRSPNINCGSINLKIFKKVKVFSEVESNLIWKNYIEI